MERHLAAIMAIHMEGFSRRMEVDETGTLSRHSSCRANHIDPNIARRNGHIVKTTSDGLLAEFASVVEAVQCAVAIQSDLAEMQAADDIDPLQYRIGINLGDVLHENGDVYGTGVNIAVRLEGLAEPGGITVSGTALDHLGSNVGVDFEYLGERRVKNISEPVRVYRVEAEGPGLALSYPGQWYRGKKRIAAVFVAVAIAIFGVAWWFARPDLRPADPARMALPLPDGPSIAVMPFDYLGPDPAINGYLADGLSGTIIATLSRLPDLLVIARSSSFSLKGQGMPAPRVSERFGVRHVLEGSVQLAGKDLRVSVQLVDGIEGRNVWAQSYSGGTQDIFDVQDRITLAVADSILGRVNPQASGGGAATRNVEAWISVVAGWDQWRRYSPEDNLGARNRFESAADLDPAYGQAWSGQAATYFAPARFGWSSDPRRDLLRAVELGETARSKDQGAASDYWVLAGALMLLKQPDRAMAVMDEALAARPGDATIVGFVGWVLKYSGHAEASLPHFARAKRLAPMANWWILANEIGAYMDLGRYDEAIVLIEAARPIWPRAYTAHGLAWLAAALGGAGRLDEAAAAVTEAMQADPSLSVAALKQWEAAYVDPSIPERRLDLFRKLGLPDTPAGN